MLKDFYQKNPKWCLIGAGGLICVLILGFFFFYHANGEEVEVKSQQITEQKETKTQNEPAKREEKNSVVVVDVKGAVRTPGVYQIPKDGRVKDAIDRAGGLLNEADPSSVNLAQKLKDEMVVEVIKKGEKGSSALAGTTASTTEKAESEKVNINQATAQDLEQVPGIGKAKATAIIEYREKEGLFTKIEDLTQISGIGEKTLEKLKAYLEI
ncbi:helix-hairpin-helix domain-containing protein [Listeria aquatica]|uniref:helix-hairpin-helix domain-containing protein n=1 Tax=Listeria aquatica TaxID=1494960 RepID=UPI003F73088E